MRNLSVLFNNSIVSLKKYRKAKEIVVKTRAKILI